MNNSSSVKNLANGLAERNATTKSARLTHWLRKKVFNQLNQLCYGKLKVIDGGQEYFFGSDVDAEIEAQITVLDSQFYWFLAFGGGVGAAEAYINHYWVSTDLTKVIQLFASNQALMQNMESGLAKIASPLKQGFHWLNKNTQRGSRKNIVAHYDLGNDFFKLFLDPSMMYSSGIFYSREDSLQQASTNKLERICNQLRLSEKDHVIEIGTGWGGFALYAAKNFGCKVTTTTISDEQYAYAAEQIKQHQLEHKITLLKQDYRDLTGQFDKLVSIEMIEAVGHQFYDAFFNKCDSLLKPDGEFLLQAITIQDQKFNQAKNEVDFIKRYIFPGSCIPSVQAINGSISKVTDMRVVNLDDIGIDYAQTLKLWKEAFFNNVEKVKQQGFSDAFIRMWDYYLSYCEGGFRERVISDVQLHYIKPFARVPSQLQSMER